MTLKILRRDHLGRKVWRKGEGVREKVKKSKGNKKIKITFRHCIKETKVVDRIFLFVCLKEDEKPRRKE